MYLTVEPLEINRSLSLEQFEITHKSIYCTSLLYIIFYPFWGVDCLVPFFIIHLSALVILIGFVLFF